MLCVCVFVAVTVLVDFVFQHSSDWMLLKIRKYKSQRESVDFCGKMKSSCWKKCVLGVVFHLFICLFSTCASALSGPSARHGSELTLGSYLIYVPVLHHIPKYCMIGVVALGTLEFLNLKS